MDDVGTHNLPRAAQPAGLADDLGRRPVRLDGRHRRQAALGVHDLRPSASDLKERKKWFRHIVVNRDIPAGTELTPDMLEGKRPEKGISPDFLDIFIGRVTKRDLEENEALSLDDI